MPLIRWNFICSVLVFLVFHGNAYISSSASHPSESHFSESQYAQLRPKFEDINRVDGINHDEAVVISQYYFASFREYYKKVVSYSQPIDEISRWRIDVRGKFGFLPIITRTHHIYIDKTSGDTYSV